MSDERPTEPWLRLSVGTGNLLQLSGLMLGQSLVRRAARVRGKQGGRLLLVGWLTTYFCNHAIGHWATGRLGGIRFVGYGLHGTTAPDWYPPGVRWVFQHLPLLSARTDKASLRAADARARMAMYLGGTVLTLSTGLGIPLYGQAARIPGARRLLFGAILWFTPMIVVEVLREQGDLHRAWRELMRIGKTRRVMR